MVAVDVVGHACVHALVDSCRARQEMIAVESEFGVAVVIVAVDDVAAPIGVVVAPQS